jgi:SAM-dependent methyltransferase
MDILDSRSQVVNAENETPLRMAAIAAMFDEGTIRHCERRGVGAGWRCLEVGGGGGSITRWLSDRVGPTGRVVATDIDTRWLEALELPNVSVRQHDITRDALPDAAFDLIHTRLVLMHLPERDEVLPRLVRALKPGGWLLLEEFDSLSAAADPAVSPGEIILKTHVAMARVMADQGVNRRYGRLLFGRLRALGLAGVDAEARMFMLHRESPGVALMRTVYHRLRQDMLDAGYLTADEFDRDIVRLDDADYMMPSPALWTVWGQRP